MLNKIKKISKYLFFTLITIAIYGLILYLIFTWLIGYSLPLAYLGNLAFMIVILVLDERLIKIFQSEEYAKKFAMRVKKEIDKDEDKNKDKDKEKGKKKENNYQLIQRHLDSAVSFKTDLYLFYIFLLVASQIIDFNSALVSENLGNFILANNYSILFLIALDMLVGQYSKDRKRTQRIAENLAKYMDENQD
jgi:lipopolysaccharide/colanic/teichoic acid biosynthesis glycosyltransferase